LNQLLDGMSQLRAGLLPLCGQWTPRSFLTARGVRRNLLIGPRIEKRGTLKTSDRAFPASSSRREQTIEPRSRALLRRKVSGPRSGRRPPTNPHGQIELRVRPARSLRYALNDSAAKAMMSATA
jgi:hypothetical protein